MVRVLSLRLTPLMALVIFKLCKLLAMGLKVLRQAMRLPSRWIALQWPPLQFLLMTRVLLMILVKAQLYLQPVMLLLTLFYLLRQSLQAGSIAQTLERLGPRGLVQALSLLIIRHTKLVTLRFVWWIRPAIRALRIQTFLKLSRIWWATLPLCLISVMQIQLTWTFSTL